MVDKDELDNTSEEDYSLLILKNRLAKGEISIDEFNTLKATLLENNPLQKIQNVTKNETGINKINQIGKEINPLPQSILGEVRPVLEYDCTYIDGHSKYRESIKGRLLLERARKESSITFHSKNNEISILIPMKSFMDIEFVSMEKRFLAKKEHKRIRIQYIDDEEKTQMPVFDLDNNFINSIYKNIIKTKDELLDPIVHTLKTRDGIKLLQLDVLSPQMHLGEGILWSQRIPRDKSDKNYQIYKVVTNYRVFVYDKEDEIMLLFLDLADVDDVVVVDRHVSSKSKGTTYFVGGYGDHLFGGVAPTNTSTYSNSIGDVVFMRQGKSKIILSELPDPDGVVNMVKSVMNELYPRT